MSDKLPPKILVAEHDEILNASLCNTIERYWFDVTRVRNADEAIRASIVNPPNVAIISSSIKDMAAIELATQLQKLDSLKDLPVIFIINKEENKENYLQFAPNVTDVIITPHSPDDLMKTIRSILRKSKPIFQDKIIKHMDISMDLSTFKVFRKARQIHLGPTEFKILQLFVQKPENVFSRRQIIDYVWGTDKEIAPRTIDVHINRIRTLIKNPEDEYHLIRTIRSAGYCLT